MIAFLRRRWWLILLPVIAGTLAGSGRLPIASGPMFAWLAGGLVVGVGMAALAEFRGSSFHTEKEVVRALGVPVLGAIPAMTPGARRQSGRRRSLTSTHVFLLAAVLGSAAAFVFWSLQS